MKGQSFLKVTPLGSSRCKDVLRQSFCINFRKTGPERLHATCFDVKVVCVQFIAAWIKLRERRKHNLGIGVVLRIELRRSAVVNEAFPHWIPVLQW